MGWCSATSAHANADWIYVDATKVTRLAATDLILLLLANLKPLAQQYCTLFTTTESLNPSE
jgi:hypothetical protein